MTAPALIALTLHTQDPRTASTLSALTDLIARMRPDLRVAAAAVGTHDHVNHGNFNEILDGLVAEGHSEIVVVPMVFATQDQTDSLTHQIVTDATTRHDGILIKVTPLLGVESTFMHLLDQRLREALSRNRVRELDALVLAGEGSADPLIRATISRAARAWGHHHKLPTIAAFASIAPPAAGEAVRAHRANGRRHVAVGMLFLAPSKHTDLVTELAQEAGAVAVAEPLGADSEIARVVLARYAVGAVDLVPLDAWAV